MATATPLATEIQTALFSHPRLLYDKKQKLCLLWSPLCASTAIVPWFFKQIGLKDDLEAFKERAKKRGMDKGAHRYRTIHHNTEGYIRHLPEVLHQSFSVIRLVRNPFSRTVSSFLQSLRMKKVFPELFATTDTSLSFAEFVDFLGTVDLQSCDPHFKVQQHPLEKMGLLTPAYMVKFESLAGDIRNTEQALGLPHIGIWGGGRTLYTKNTECHAHRKFSLEDIQKGVPHYRHFYTTELERKIRNFYAEDFAAYGYSTEL